MILMQWARWFEDFNYILIVQFDMVRCWTLLHLFMSSLATICLCVIDENICPEYFHSVHIVALVIFQCRWKFIHHLVLEAQKWDARTHIIQNDTTVEISNSGNLWDNVIDTRFEFTHLGLTNDVQLQIKLNWKCYAYRKFLSCEQ